MVIYTPPTATQPQFHPRFSAFRFAHPQSSRSAPSWCMRLVPLPFLRHPSI